MPGNGKIQISSSRKGIFELDHSGKLVPARLQLANDSSEYYDKKFDEKYQSLSTSTVDHFVGNVLLDGGYTKSESLLPVYAYENDLLGNPDTQKDRKTTRTGLTGADGKPIYMPLYNRRPEGDYYFIYKEFPDYKISDQEYIEDQYYDYVPDGDQKINTINPLTKEKGILPDGLERKVIKNHVYYIDQKNKVIYTPNIISQPEYYEHPKVQV